MMSKEEVILMFANITHQVNLTNDDLDRFLLNNKITSGRDFRRNLRKIRDIASDTIKSSLELEKQMREVKKEKKEKKNAGL